MEPRARLRRIGSGVESCMDMLKLESALVFVAFCGSNMAAARLPGELQQL
jgi:hypothetical protein